MLNACIMAVEGILQELTPKLQIIFLFATSEQKTCFINLQRCKVRRSYVSIYKVYTADTLACFISRPISFSSQSHVLSYKKWILLQIVVDFTQIN